MKRMNDEDKRTEQVPVYFSKGEDAALNTLATDFAYHSKGDVIRRSLAAFIKAQHPDLLKLLRKDLIQTLDSR